ncbi:MAG TPA: peroxiredoxin-like family protein [Planctomycetaceae bacterium]|nr:peroxiredoxin-like family protein [Planctomycetaceae bacterium]
MDAPDTALEAAVTQTGRSLAELSRASPLLVVFLRHGGCPFCRESLADVAAKRTAIEGSGVTIVLVHLMSDEQARELFARYGLDDVPRISDPDRRLYAAFELQRGGVGDVIGPRVWWRGFQTAILSGHLFGKPAGDVFQLPGAFLLVDGRIVRAHRGRTSADVPNLDDLTSCPLPAPQDVRHVDS